MESNSVCDHRSDWQNRTTAQRESDLLITSMITDWIGRHDVLLPINQNYGKIREANKPSIEPWMILKRRYECWKTQQFTLQSAPQREQNDAYCPITSMTCATVQLMLKSGCWWPIKIENFVIVLINDGNRTEWSPIRSVIIRVINKIRRPRSGSPIC